MATAEQIAGVIPGKAQICRSCDNFTGSFGCKVDVQSGFFLGSGAQADQKAHYGAGMETKLSVAPDGCPIKILLRVEGNQ